jgi:hypothetical protein
MIKVIGLNDVGCKVKNRLSFLAALEQVDMLIVVR